MKILLLIVGILAAITGYFFIKKNEQVSAATVAYKAKSYADSYVPPRWIDTVDPLDPVHLSEPPINASLVEKISAPRVINSPLSNTEAAILAGQMLQEKYFASGPGGIEAGIREGWISPHYSFEIQQRETIEKAIAAGTYSGTPTGPFPEPPYGPPDVLRARYGDENISWDKISGSWITP